MNIKEFFDLMGPEIESWVGEKIYNTCTKVRPGSPIQIYLEPTSEEEFYVFYGPDTDPLIFSTWEWEKEFKEISKLIPIKRKCLLLILKTSVSILLKLSFHTAQTEHTFHPW